MFAISRGFKGHRIQVGISLFLFFWIAVAASFGSLVITIYQGKAIFIGSDSMATSASGKQVRAVQKIFPFSTNACAALTGFAFLKAGAIPGKPEYSLNLIDALEKVCEREFKNKTSVGSKIEVITRELNLRCRVFFEDPAVKLPPILESGKARLQFVGYNPETKRYFVKSFVLGLSDDPKFDLDKEFADSKTDPHYVGLQGESKFLEELLSRKTPALWKLVSPDFNKINSNLTNRRNVPDYQIKNYILEMFYLHRQNAARFGTDKGWVGPPYRVFKISKDKVTLLTPEPAPSSSPEE